MNDVLAGYQVIKDIDSIEEIEGYTCMYRYKDPSLYDDYSCPTEQVHLQLEKYVVAKETHRGVWVVPSYHLWVAKAMKEGKELDDYGKRVYKTFKRFILKNAVKRLAYETKEQSLVGYIARKRMHIAILKGKLKAAEIGEAIAKEMMKGGSGGTP